MMPAPRPRFREISDGDIDAIADLLTRGFVHRPRDYWMRGLLRQRTRKLPEGTPRYGYMLDNAGTPVGCLLLLYSSRPRDGEIATFCNVSSWYVDPEFRSYAAMLASSAQKRTDVTYFNVTPAAFTWPVIEAQGFQRYCNGLLYSLPALSPAGRGMTIEPIAPDTRSVDGLPDTELEILTRHAGYGCLSLVCRSPEGPAPFIFLQLRKRRGLIPVPALQLAYCRGIPDFVRCAGAIGRYLLLRGKPVVLLDANGPVTGLPGLYSEARGRKYFKGPHRPQLGDLTDTELAIYGM
jgi:hypothetical protein